MAPMSSESETALREASQETRWKGARILWIFAVINWVAAVWFPSLVGGAFGDADGGAAFRLGAYVSAGVYALLGGGVLAGYIPCMYVALAVYIFDSVWALKVRWAGGDAIAAVRLAVSRSWMSWGLYKTAETIF